MAASTHWLATGTAQAVLERGGNAVDAAVAAGFVLHVVEPHLNGPAGDLVGIISDGESNPQSADRVRHQPAVICGQGQAPAAASIEHFASLGLDHVPGAGALAAVAPGSVPAWLHLLATRGTWDIADLLTFAIEYAEDGHAASEQLCGVIERMAPHFTDHWTTSVQVWMPDGVPVPGQLIRNPAYARTLRRLLEAADLAAPATADNRLARIDAVRRAWQEGFVAEALADTAGTVHRHSDGRDYAGVLTVADQAAFQPVEEASVHLEFRGARIHKAGAWTQGPVLLQTLAILDQVEDSRLDPSTELGAHTIIEALKLALADRDAYYGPGCDDATVTTLLSPEYAAARAALIGDQAATQWRPGEVPGVSPFRPSAATARTGHTPDSPTTGEPTVRPTGATRGDTCHLDVVDRHGTLVSVTPSGGWLQSNPAVPELGFPLGTRLQMTWLDPASPSALGPGTRPRTTLSPTLVSLDGRPHVALGTPGGDQQDQWQLLYLLRTLVGGYTPQQAIDAPALHTTDMISSFWPRVRTPGGVVTEGRLGTDTIDGLRRRGHEVTIAPDWSLGRLSAVGRDPRTGEVWAAANSRGEQGYAAGR